MIKVTIKKQLNLNTCYCNLVDGINSSSCSYHCTVYPECGSDLQTSATYNSLSNTWGGGVCFTMTAGGNSYNTIGYTPGINIWQIIGPFNTTVTGTGQTSGTFSTTCPVFQDDDDNPSVNGGAPSEGIFGRDSYDWAGGNYEDVCSPSGAAGTTSYCMVNSELEIYCGNYTAGLNSSSQADCFCYENSVNFYAGSEQQ